MPENAIGDNPQKTVLSSFDNGEYYADFSIKEVLMREDIKQIYLSDRWTYDSIMDFNFDESDDDRRFYVYEWHTNNGHIFYIGKGTGKRYNHILKEIETFENNSRKYKGSAYKTLKDTYGIGYSILMSELTKCEALIMENYYIIKQLCERKPLLNIISPCLPEEVEEWWYDIRWNTNILDFYK